MAGAFRAAPRRAPFSSPTSSFHPATLFFPPFWDPQFQMGNPGKSAKTGRRSATEKAQDVEDARKADVMVNSKCVLGFILSHPSLCSPIRRALDHLKQTNTRKAPPSRKGLPPTGGRPAASTSRTSRSSILDKHKAKFTGNGRSGSVHGEESRREAERAEGTAASDDDADESDGLDRDETNEGLEEELEVAEGREWYCFFGGGGR